MASRRLALNLRQSMRSRAAINAVKTSRASPLTRGLATPVSYGAKTESTTLGNGFTIATEHSPWAQTSTVGVWIDAGSRAETDETNGTAHFLEHLAFKVGRPNGRRSTQEADAGNRVPRSAHSSNWNSR
ncbi:mitochondrial-processing peptidase subunit beta [Pyrenophora tritici-repentis]|nr:mitochondrial-processing peptidase subunit beta [Pyrenophora tritici-repentis]